MFMDALGLEFTIIEVGQTQEERAAAAIYFNNPDSPSPVVHTA